MAHPAQADSLPQESLAQAPYSGVLAPVLTCAAPAMHMLKVTVMMKRTHELGDGEDDHTVWYMSEVPVQYNKDSVFCCGLENSWRNAWSPLLIMHCAVLYTCIPAVFVGTQYSKIVLLGSTASGLRCIVLCKRNPCISPSDSCCCMPIQSHVANASIMLLSTSHASKTQYTCNMTFGL